MRKSASPSSLSSNLSTTETLQERFLKEKASTIQQLRPLFLSDYQVTSSGAFLFLTRKTRRTLLSGYGLSPFGLQFHSQELRLSRWDARRMNGRNGGMMMILLFTSLSVRTTFISMQSLRWVCSRPLDLLIYHILLPTAMFFSWTRRLVVVQILSHLWHRSFSTITQLTSLECTL